jgi:hypothetical protein
MKDPESVELDAYQKSLTPELLQEMQLELKKPVARNIDINLRIALIDKKLKYSTDLSHKEKIAL